MPRRLDQARIVAAAFALVAILPWNAAAQDERWAPQSGPSIRASFGSVATSDVADSGQRYGYRDFGLGVSVPIEGGWDWDQMRISGFRLLLHGGFQADSAVVPYTSDRRTLYRLEAGLSAIHVLSRNNQIAWSIGAGFAEDDDTISKPKGRLTGRVIAHHRSSEKLTLLYGAAYTFVLGKGRLLPIFGVLWRPSPRTTVSILGPVAGRVHQRVGSHLILGAQAGLRGNQYRIANNQRFSSANDELHLGNRELRLGVEVGIVLGRSLALFGEAGIATTRRLTFADGRTELFSSSVGSQPYGSIGLHYSFSKQPRWEDLGAGR